jgi:hypothetical protein
VSAASVPARAAIAWSASATVGAIAGGGASLLTGVLGAGLVDCRLRTAGKFRNGATRWWCVSHQAYWGVNADLARADGRCRAASMPLSIALDPLLIDPLLLDAGAAPLRLSLQDGAIAIQSATLDLRVPALALRAVGVFRHPAIDRVDVTPPALAAMAFADGCVDCARCGYPHLDLGEFAVRAHRRHTCGHCGNDSTHSATAIVSNPLFLLRERVGFAP